MLMRLMSKGEYLIVPKGTKFTGSGKLGLKQGSSKKSDAFHFNSYTFVFKNAHLARFLTNLLKNIVLSNNCNF